MSDLLQWLNLHPELAGLATFIIAAAESIAIIGTLIPGTVTMTAIGALAGAGVIPLYATVIYAMLGAIVGDGVSYWIGRYFNERLPNLWPFRSYPSLLANGELFVRKHGGKSVFIGRFVGPVRALVPLVAGMLGMSPIRFTIANILSAIGWAPAYMLPGILLGAASLELPPDIAVHVILMLLLTGLLIIFCIWLIQKIFKLIGHQIDQLLTWFWNRLRKYKYFSLITFLLKHHNPKKTYGQLTLAFYFIVICIVLFNLATYIFVRGSDTILLNNAFFHIARDIRTPLWDNIMLSISFLGESAVVLPLILTLSIWLAWTKRWHTAWHVFFLGILSVVSIETLKKLIHSTRPWGVLHNNVGFSFPSGHATFAVVIYSGIALLLMQACQIKSKRFIYIITGIIIAAISLSRIYLGAHWLTDIIGGWLLGSALLMLITLSYSRKTEKTLHPIGIILTIFITLFLSYSFNFYRSFNKLKLAYTQLDWPTISIPLSAWWNQQGKQFTPQRINRLGSAQQVLNLQWLEDIAAIKTVLLQNGWEIPPARSWIDVLHRISDVQSTEHLPLVSPLYLDKKPILILIKHTTKNKKFVVLRLWDSHRLIEHSKQPLWVGSVEIVPRTYSWLFKRNNWNTQLKLTPALLFNTIPSQYEVKEVRVKLTIKNHPENVSMILIKRK